MKADGGLSVIKAKYIFEPGIDDPEPVVFEKYNGADTIQVAVTGDLPPIDFVRADGAPAGIILSESYFEWNNYFHIAKK